MIKEFKTTHHDRDVHTKALHELDWSHCTIEVRDYDGTGPNPEAWASIMLKESYMKRGGKRPVTRTISMDLSADERAQLISMLGGSVK